MPIGLEYLQGMIAATEHESQLLDLCFEKDVEKILTEKVAEYNPDLIGITIRQIDTVLYQNNEYFLPAIKDLVTNCKDLAVPVVLGGAGFSILAKEILDFTNADFGIKGPGEFALLHLLDCGLSNKNRLLDGFSFFSGNTVSVKRSLIDNSKPYVDNGGIAGFRTQIGCTGDCIFCTEARKPLIFHEPQTAAEEIKLLQKKGFTTFHLCDSEFNQNLDHCYNLCNTLIDKTGPIQWALYMKPEPVSEKLFFLLKKSGAHLITLSIDSITYPPSNFSILTDFFHLTKTYNIDVIVDLSVGLPGEEKGNTEKLIQFLAHTTAKSIGINAYYRIYKDTNLYNEILKNESLANNILDGKSINNILEPVFYNSHTIEHLREVIGDNDTYRIEGFEKAVNYQR